MKLTVYAMHFLVNQVGLHQTLWVPRVKGDQKGGLREVQGSTTICLSIPLDTMYNQHSTNPQHLLFLFRILTHGRLTSKSS